MGHARRRVTDTNRDEDHSGKDEHRIRPNSAARFRVFRRNRNMRSRPFRAIPTFRRLGFIAFSATVCGGRQATNNQRRDVITSVFGKNHGGDGGGADGRKSQRSVVVVVVSRFLSCRSAHLATSGATIGFSAASGGREEAAKCSVPRLKVRPKSRRARFNYNA